MAIVRIDGPQVILDGRTFLGVPATGVFDLSHTHVTVIGGQAFFFSSRTYLISPNRILIGLGNYPVTEINGDFQRGEDGQLSGTIVSAVPVPLISTVPLR